MTDKPFPELQAELKASNMGSINYANRAPLCCDGEVETVHEIRKAHWIWKWVGAALLCVVIAAVSMI